MFTLQNYHHDIQLSPVTMYNYVFFFLEMSHFKTYSLRNFQISNTELLIIAIMLHLTFPGFMYLIAEHLPLTPSQFHQPPPPPGSGAVRLSSASMSLLFSLFCATQLGSCDICLSAFFHLAYCPQSPSVLSKMARFHFLWLNPLFIYTIFSWSIYEEMTLRLLPYLGVTIVNTAAVNRSMNLSFWNVVFIFFS